MRLFIYAILSLILFSCSQKDVTKLELLVISGNKEIMPETKVTFFVNSETASENSIDSTILADENGKVSLEMPGECYLYVIGVNYRDTVTYAGSREVHLKENQTTIDTLIIY